MMSKESLFSLCISGGVLLGVLFKQIPLGLLIGTVIGCYFLNEKKKDT